MKHWRKKGRKSSLRRRRRMHYIVWPSAQQKWLSLDFPSLWTVFISRSSHELVRLARVSFFVLKNPNLSCVHLRHTQRPHREGKKRLNDVKKMTISFTSSCLSNDLARSFGNCIHFFVIFFCLYRSTQLLTQSQSKKKLTEAELYKSARPLCDEHAMNKLAGLLKKNVKKP